MLNKKTKDGVITTLILTALFVSGSTPLYDATTSSAAADGSIYRPILKPATLPGYTAAPLQTGADILTQLPNIAKLTNKIDELESTIESKDMRITAIKVQKDTELNDLRNTYVSIDQALIELSEYVGKSPYGFGDSPERWDCSGLTLWFYKTYRGIELEHSATEQMLNGEVVDAPIPGDLVVFRYARSKSAFHVGIYMGAGMFIHAKNANADTVLERVEDFATKNIRVAYIRY